METDPGHNVLISAGQPLLQALIMLAQKGTPPDLTLFRQQMLQGVSRFYRICAAHRLHPSLTGKSAFVWCAALDEAVLSTSWGAESVWQEHTLTGAAARPFSAICISRCITPFRCGIFSNYSFICYHSASGGSTAHSRKHWLPVIPGCVIF